MMETTTPEPDTSDDALALFAAFHARSARCCDALDALMPASAPSGSALDPGRTATAATADVQPTGTQGVDARAADATAALVEFFDIELPRHERHEDELLLPALIESMAGSDPVCLRELAAALGDEHRALDLGWRRARAALLASSRPNGAAADAVVAFTAALRRHLAHEDDELLPMAARLIGDDELARIAHRMRDG